MQAGMAIALAVLALIGTISIWSGFHLSSNGSKVDTADSSAMKYSADEEHGQIPVWNAAGCESSNPLPSPMLIETDRTGARPSLKFEQPTETPASSVPQSENFLHKTTDGHIPQETGYTMGTVPGQASPEEDKKTPPRIAGRVQDSGGRPVPMIAVTATERNNSDGEKPHFPTKGQLLRTITDGEGFFHFSDLNESDYLLAVEATDTFLDAKKIVRAGVMSVLLTVQTRYRQPIFISGTVTNSQGAPLTGVRIKPAGHAEASTTDKSGRYFLSITPESKKTTITVRFDHADFRAESRQIQPAYADEGNLIGLDVQMQPLNLLTTVGGSVHGTAGVPVKWAGVRLFSSDTGSNYQTVTDREGQFRLERVESNMSYRVMVLPREKYQNYLRENVTVPENGLVMPIILESSGSGTISGLMVDMLGEPIVHFSIWMRPHSMSGQMLQKITSDHGGRFFIENFPTGEISFFTLSEPFLSVSGFELFPGPENRAELVLDWGKDQIEGYVLSEQGAPIAGSEVSLLWQYDQNNLVSRSKRQTITDRNGHFLFSRLGPGTHTLVAKASGYQSIRNTIDNTSNIFVINLHKL